MGSALLRGSTIDIVHKDSQFFWILMDRIDKEEMAISQELINKTDYFKEAFPYMTKTIKALESLNNLSLPPYQVCKQPGNRSGTTIDNASYVAKKKTAERH